MCKKQTILIVEDTEVNLQILTFLLEDDYRVRIARSGKEALALLKKVEIDLIFMDIVMPEMDGYEVCSILKSQPKTAHIPVLFITAKTDEESIAKAYDVGGVDYVTKPFKPKELLARMNTHLKLSETLRALEYLATRDSMTGLYNRRKFFELGEALFAQSDTLLAVMIDIDKFKNINDTYGHALGDEVIKCVAKTVLSMLPSDTIFGRLGGEEFAILIARKHLETSKQTIEEIRKAVASMKIMFNTNRVHVTISSGVAKKELSDTLDHVLKRADDALYEAKGTGRNRSCFRV